MRNVILLAIVLTLGGCVTSRWADSAEWFSSEEVVCDSLVDVFYIVSTEILDEKDASGKDAYIGKLTAPERTAICAEMNYARQMFGDSLNFFSPYYKQFTMSALSLPEAKYMKYRAKASRDASKAFRYYLRHLNGGRPFILAGFSQGSMHLVDIVRSMSRRDRQRMVTAYSMGYRLSAQDMKHRGVLPSQSSDDRGTIVSFTSVAARDYVWPAVSGDAATCINPINYCTDATPATFVFEGDTLSVRVDTCMNVLVVNSPNISKYHFPILEPLCKPGNLHHWDLLFYRDAIRRNALDRAQRFLEGLRSDTRQ